MTNFTTRPEILGTFGVVTSTHWLASAVGMSILEKDGNAFDAAVATGFALQIVEPHLNGPGGEVPILVAPKGGDVQVICGQGVAPQAASLSAFDKLGLSLVPGNGLLSAVVPGAFDAWMLLLRDFGSMDIADVLAPAISLARNGYPVVPNITNTINSVKQLFETEWKTSAKLYLPGGSPPLPGTLFRNVVLADTYQRLVDEANAGGGGREKCIERARNVWSQGFIAESIDRFCREEEVMDSTGRRHGGLLTGDDLASWRASIDAPLCYDYHGFTVCKTGPWGQGPVFLQQLSLLKGFELDNLSPTDPEFVHLVVESSKLAFADRECFYGDPDFVDVPMAQLLSDEYASVRRGLIGSSASHDLRPGKVPGYGWDIGARAVSVGSSEIAGGQGIGEPTVARFASYNSVPDGEARGDTVHFDIIDRHGNMVSATPSGGWLQSSPIIPDLGFCLNNRAQMYWLDKEAPSCLMPGKRPRTTLSPGLVLRDGEPYMVFGTPGGDQQDQWALHMFLRHVHYAQNLQEAIDAPGFNSEHLIGSFYPRHWNPGHLALEERMPSGTIDELKRRGHAVCVDEPWSLGRVTAACKDGDLLKAAANPRFMQGYAIGR